MPHVMKPCLTKEDHNAPIHILEMMKEDTNKIVKPQDVFVGFKQPPKKSVKVCPKGNKVCHCSNKKKVPKGSHRMPDGSIMKDSDMKKKGKSKY